MHSRVSGVAHYSAKEDADCLTMIRRLFVDLPAAPERRSRADGAGGSEAGA